MAEDYQNEIDGLMKQISVLYEEIYDELACSQWRAFEDEKHDHTHAQTMEGCLYNYDDGVKRDHILGQTEVESFMTNYVNSMLF